MSMTSSQPSTDRPWLVVIDPQHVFADPSSPWGSPMWPQVAPRIVALAEQHAGRVLLTRFVPGEPVGSWADYYRDWPWAQVAGDDPLYAVVPELVGVADRELAAPTFGKWGPSMREIVGDAAGLVLTGVSTDCCVLATALAAADAGAHVQVRADACAGSTPENHERALAAMELFAPQIQVLR